MTTPGTPAPLDPADHERSLANLKLERDAIVLYDGLARVEKDPRRQAAFRAIAANERRHADIWARRLRESGVAVPDAGPARARVRFILGMARIFGTRSVSDLVQAMEGDEEEIYDAQSGPEVAGIAADEREHAEIWKRMEVGLPALPEGLVATGTATDTAAGAGTPGTPADPATPGSPGTTDTPADTQAPASARGVQASRIAAAAPRTGDERWHRAGQSGTLRAAIFGINDGLVSNLALVMGVAGAAPSNGYIVLAGVAGLLAGAFSMGAGEWISMQSQRELFERQIALEREELRIMPEVERAELAGIYRAKGLRPREADLVAERLMADPEHALDTMVREELGLDPNELGSAWGAASWSFVSFSIGAIIPLAPFLVSSGTTAIVVSFVLALIALFVVGAGVSLLTGRSLLFSGTRQVLIGGAAAVVTYIVGSVIGVQVAG